MTGKAPAIDVLLADCLSALEQGEALEAVLSRYPQQAEALKPLLEMGVWMRAEQSQVAPRPGFVPASRSRLVAKIESEKAATKTGWTARLAGIFGGARLSQRYAFLQIVIVVLVMGCLIFSSSGIAYAAQASLPGERLYPVKLAIEEAELLIARSPEQEIRLHTRFAQRRLMEMQELVLQGRTEHIGVAAALYNAHIDRSLALLEGLAYDNPRTAREMATSLQSMYQTQARWLGFLQDQAPDSAWGVIEAVRDAAGEGAGKAGLIQRETDDPPVQAGTSTIAPTPTPEARVGGLAMTTVTPTNPSAPTRTPVPGGRNNPTKTNTAAPTNIALAAHTATPTHNSGTLPDSGRATPTSPPTVTKPPAPSATATRPIPTATQPQPTATNTLPAPTATRTSPPPTATNTSPPPPTNTPVPPPTNTPVPLPTNTPVPPPTNTPVPPRPTDTPPPYPGP